MAAYLVLCLTSRTRGDTIWVVIERIRNPNQQFSTDSKNVNSDFIQIWVEILIQLKKTRLSILFFFPEFYLFEKE